MLTRKGFTLIEVLIVVIILGILATIAIPQFANMITRARLAEAWSGLGAGRAAAEVYNLENTTYLGMTIANLQITDTENFTFSFVADDGTPTAPTAAAYILRATGRGAAGNANVSANVIADVRQDGARRSSITGQAGLGPWSF